MAVRTDPVIFLVFADAWRTEGQRAPLRELVTEVQRIRDALSNLEREGKCELVERFDPTPKQIFEVFADPRYSKRIAIFHFAGHANGYQLLLRKTEPALAAEFASFLGRQQSLRLVFLNGCSTEPQVEELLASGASAVIATSQAIDDGIASDSALVRAGTRGGVLRSRLCDS